MRKKFICTLQIDKGILDKVKEYKDIEGNLSGLKRVFLAIPDVILNGEAFEEAILNVKVVAASVKLLSDIFEKSGIDNVVSLNINGDIVFEDKNGNDNDLPLMLEAVKNSDIKQLDIATLIMESQVLHDDYIYTVDILRKDDDSVEVTIVVVDENTANDSSTEEDDFNSEIELLLKNINDSGVLITRQKFS